MCKICTLLSYGLCGTIRWPLTRARAALTQQGYTLRLLCYAQHFLSSSRPTVLLTPVGRGDHTSPPGIAPQLMKKPCHCEDAPRPRRSVSPAPQKEVTLRPPLNFCLRGGAYSSSSWPTRAICNSSSCFCTPHKMAEHFAGSPRRISILGGSEFRLRQGFAVQNAWCGAKAAGRNPHGRSLLLLQLAHQSNMQFV